MSIVDRDSERRQIMQLQWIQAQLMYGSLAYFACLCVGNLFAADTSPKPEAQISKLTDFF